MQTNGVSKWLAPTAVLLSSLLGLVFFTHKVSAAQIDTTGVGTTGGLYGEKGQSWDRTGISYKATTTLTLASLKMELAPQCVPDCGGNSYSMHVAVYNLATSTSSLGSLLSNGISTSVGAQSPSSEYPYWLFQFVHPLTLQSGNWYAFVVEQDQNQVGGHVLRIPTVALAGDISKYIGTRWQSNGNIYDYDVNSVIGSILFNTINPTDTTIDSSGNDPSQPFIKVIHPASYDGNGHVFYLHSQQHQSIQIQVSYPPDDNFVFWIRRSYISPDFENNATASTTNIIDFAGKPSPQEGGFFDNVYNGQTHYFQLNISNNAQTKTFQTTLFINGDDSQPTIPDYIPPDLGLSPLNNFTCSIPYIKWDPCSQLQYVGNIFGNQINKLASSTINGLIDKKPYSYVKDTFKAMQLGSASSTTTTIPVVSIIIPTSTAFTNMPHMNYDPIPSDLFTRFVPQSSWDVIRSWAVLILNVGFAFWIIRRFMKIS